MLHHILKLLKDVIFLTHFLWLCLSGVYASTRSLRLALLCCGVLQLEGLNLFLRVVDSKEVVRLGLAEEEGGTFVFLLEPVRTFLLIHHHH